MIFSKKAGIRLGTSSRLLTDLGDFYAIGAQICNKSLQASMQATIDGVCTGTTLHVKGNYQKLNSSTSDANSRAMLNFKGLLSPYFDSLQGATAGNRYLVAAGDSATNASGFAISRVLSDGSTEGFSGASQGTIAEGRAFIFAESTNNFYVAIIAAGVDAISSNYSGIGIYSVAKATKVSTPLLAPAANGSTISTSGYWNMIFEGIYNGLAIFSLCAKIKSFDGSAATQEFGYCALNLSTGSISKVSNSTAWAGASATAPTCQTIMLPHPSDASKQCFYVCGSKGTGAVALTDQLSIHKATFNSNIQAPDTVTASNWATMTLAGAPADFIYGISSYAQALVLETYGFTNNGTNYIVVVKHSKNIPAAPNNYANKMWLFKVESDGSTATFLHGLTLGREYTDTIPSYDGKTIICAKANDGFAAYRFDAGSQQMVASEYYARSGLRKIAVDHTNTIFCIYDDATSMSGLAMDIINMNNSGVLTATFQGSPESLQYTGTPIEINVLISAYDMFGVRLVRNINVYAEGCVFKDNGGGTAQAFTTDAAQDLTITMIVSAPGVVNITPEFA